MFVESANGDSATEVVGVEEVIIWISCSTLSGDTTNGNQTRCDFAVNVEKMILVPYFFTRWRTFVSCVARMGHGTDSQQSPIDAPLTNRLV